MIEKSEIGIRLAGDDDVSALITLGAALGKSPSPDYFHHCLNLQKLGKRALFVVDWVDEYSGTKPLAAYGILNWAPKYQLYARANIPEIQDLNVHPGMRRRGIATAMIEYCEDKARNKGYSDIGISFGLHASYGPAQRLYFKLGYMPDGQGATYDRKIVDFGTRVPMDDDLCLMLVKPLVVISE